MRFCGLSTETSSFSEADMMWWELLLESLMLAAQIMADYRRVIIGSTFKLAVGMPGHSNH